MKGTTCIKAVNIRHVVNKRVRGVYGVVYEFKLVAEKAMKNNAGERQPRRTSRFLLVRTIDDVFVGFNPDQPMGNEHLCMQET
ncbi:hypothetical protein AAVH_19429 [Aphelenchoides avenae]|nr:hypothetical protein AAVH_19429 [Aphelenchus avenae]